MLAWFSLRSRGIPHNSRSGVRWRGRAALRRTDPDSGLEEKADGEEDNPHPDRDDALESDEQGLKGVAARQRNAEGEVGAQEEGRKGVARREHEEAAEGA